MGDPVSDRIVLTLPSERRFRSVATLVLGGIGGRGNLSYERMDDLQLAVLSVLEAADDDAVTLEVDTDDGELLVAIGRVRRGTSEDAGLSLVLSRLVDEIAHEERDGGEWVTLRLATAAR
jgi:hypothetical protein